MPGTILSTFHNPFNPVKENLELDSKVAKTSFTQELLQQEKRPQYRTGLNITGINK